MKRCRKCGGTDWYKLPSDPRPRCRTCRKRSSAAWVKRNAKQHARKNRSARIQKKYGISLADYERMLAQQKGRCAICGDPPGKNRLAVDHNHQTGAVRGLLCVRCNTSLERVELLGWLTSATMYLNRHTEPT